MKVTFACASVIVEVDCRSAGRYQTLNECNIHSGDLRLLQTVNQAGGQVHTTRKAIAGPPKDLCSLPPPGPFASSSNPQAPISLKCLSVRLCPVYFNVSRQFPSPDVLSPLGLISVTFKIECERLTELQKAHYWFCEDAGLARLHSHRKGRSDTADALLWKKLHRISAASSS